VGLTGDVVLIGVEGLTGGVGRNNAAGLTSGVGLTYDVVLPH
jgi:hypothetical protein